RSSYCYDLTSSRLPQLPRSTLFPYTTLFRSRHSGSKVAKVKLVPEHTHIVLEVADQGQGMAAHNNSNHVPGVGITGMRERVHERSEEHTSELQSLAYLVCRLLLEKKKQIGQN